LLQFDIYGKVRTFKGNKTFIPFRYQGQYEDIETGLYYNRFRYYSPDTGTYISQDPIGLKGDKSSFYSYVIDSNSLIDPFGLIEILSEMGVSVHAYPGPDVGGIEHLNPLHVHMYEGGIETKIALEDFETGGKKYKAGDAIPGKKEKNL